MTGTIKSTTDRGFGFITDRVGDDFFFHLSDCESTQAFYAFREGDVVTFESVEPQPPKGRRARLVRMEGPAPNGGTSA